MNTERKDRKNLLYTIMIVSFAPIIFFPLLQIFRGYFIFPQDFLVVVGTWLGLIAFMFIFWQYGLGVKAFTSLFTEDIKVTNHLHQTLGIYGFFLILLHPIIIFVAYLTERGENLINLDFSTAHEVAIKFGTLALTLVIFNWFVSYYFRSHFSFRWWKRIHLINYLILPLIYLHANTLGEFLEDPILNAYFKFLTFIFILIFLHRLGKQFGFFKYKYSVASIKDITHDVVEVSFAPVKPNRFIKPREGQFIELQRKVWGETHPFTASRYNQETHELSISPKNSGPFSAALKNLKIGDKVFLDGPYGMFTKEAYDIDNKKIVLIIGGIGITPFLRLFDHLKEFPNTFDELVLFYGNKTPDDIAYKSMLEEQQNINGLKVVHVLSEEGNYDPSFEKGHITTDLMKKYLKQDLSNYKFFICGPPPMMKAVTSDLESNGVISRNIYSEKFTW